MSADVEEALVPPPKKRGRPSRLERNENGEIRCPLCDRYFSATVYSRHPPCFQVNCPVCGVVIKHKNNLPKHLKTHDKKKSTAENDEETEHDEHTGIRAESTSHETENVSEPNVAHKQPPLEDSTVNNMQTIEVNVEEISSKKLLVEEETLSSSHETPAASTVQEYVQKIMEQWKQDWDLERGTSKLKAIEESLSVTQTKFVDLETSVNQLAKTYEINLLELKTENSDLRQQLEELSAQYQGCVKKNDLESYVQELLNQAIVGLETSVNQLANTYENNLLEFKNENSDLRQQLEELSAQYQGCVKKNDLESHVQELLNQGITLAQPQSSPLEADENSKTVGQQNQCQVSNDDDDDDVKFVEVVKIQPQVTFKAIRHSVLQNLKPFWPRLAALRNRKPTKHAQDWSFAPCSQNGLKQLIILDGGNISRINAKNSKNPAYDASMVVQVATCFLREGFPVKIVFSKNAFQKYLSAAQIQDLENLEKEFPNLEKVRFTSNSFEDDGFMLHWMLRSNGYIISNDHFDDYVIRAHIKWLYLVSKRVLHVTIDGDQVHLFTYNGRGKLECIIKDISMLQSSTEADQFTENVCALCESESNKIWDILEGH